MMGIGFPELMVILVIIMIIFGAGKLPEIGHAFGRSIKNFKSSMKEAEQESIEEDAPASEAGTESVASESTAQDAAKKEEKIIDEAAEFIEKNRSHTNKPKHDGLGQHGDVFTNSLVRTPGGSGSDRGVSRDVF